MIWFYLALIGAFLTAAYWILLKKSLKDIDQFTLAGGVFLVSSAVLFIYSMANGIPSIGEFFYIALFSAAISNAAVSALTYYALSTCELSLSIPMLSFTPVFLILTSYLILGEKTSLLGALGILFIVFGCIVIETGKECGKRKNWNWRKGEFLMLIVAFLYSICGNLDKMLIKNSDPTFGTAFEFLIMCAILWSFSVFKEKKPTKIFKENFWAFVVLGLVCSVSTIFINTALQIQIVPYVIAIKRLSILFAVLYGAIILKEHHPARRILGAGIMVAGAIIIAMF
ncbi:MAG: EamA family transporter [Candidatus Gracilibacteria bacterium]